MSNSSNDEQLQKAIQETTADLETAKHAIEELANELVNVVEIIEPALADQAQRIRQARMSSLHEIKQVTDALREMRHLLMAPETEQMLLRAERFLKALRDLEEFRACGALESFARAFEVVTP